MLRILVLTLCLLTNGLDILAQAPPLRLRFSKLLATYDFLQRLQAKAEPGLFRDAYAHSPFNRPAYNTLLAGFDTLTFMNRTAFGDTRPGRKSR